MGNQVPYTNTKDRAVSIGGKRLAPGQTRLVDETMIPGFRRHPVADAPRDPLLEILDQPVKDIVAQLPGLSDEQFVAVTQAEQDGKTRKTLLKAFEEERLRRAELAAEAGTDDQSTEES